jgi:hypothetical protein
MSEQPEPAGFFDADKLMPRKWRGAPWVTPSRTVSQLMRLQTFLATIAGSGEPHSAYYESVFCFVKLKDCLHAGRPRLAEKRHRVMVDYLRARQEMVEA